MKKVTSLTVFGDAVGMRMSFTYSEINKETGMIESDNNRIDRVITDSDAKEDAQRLIEYAQNFLD